jgi:2-C-methyl-D-erythritol 2,4-cyclodiphosphate synthase
VSFRIGNGFDVHRFSDDPARSCVLGGVTFDGVPGLDGNSDADVVAHAVAEAVLGAAGLDDLGSLYPDDDERFAGADSLHLLADVMRRATEAGWHVVNVDCSVIAERPKLAPHRRTMEAKLSAVVAAPVTVKGRRAESLGALGRAEGVACFASALITTIEARLL